MAGEVTIEVDTALAKLARTLDVERAEVAFLDHLDVDVLRDLYWKLNDVLGEANHRRLQGVVAASRLLPAGLAATIGEKWFGPVLCAQLVGLLEPARAGQYAKHLSVEFMADITARTDPRVVGDLIHELSLPTMQEIAVRLVERDDFLTLSHFVGHVPAEVVAAVLDAIEDDAAVVRIARFVDDLNHLDPIVARLPDDRIVRLVRAVDDQDLWVDGLHLFSHLGDTQITRLATTIVGADDGVIRAAVTAFDRHGLWEQGIMLVERLDGGDLVSFAEVLLDVDDALVEAAVAAIDAHDAWDTLVRLALAGDDLSGDIRVRLRRLVEELPDSYADAFDRRARQLGHPDLLDRVLND